MSKSKQHRLTTECDILSSFVHQVKYYHVTYVDDEDEKSKFPVKVVMNL